MDSIDYHHLRFLPADDGFIHMARYGNEYEDVQRVLTLFTYGDTVLHAGCGLGLIASVIQATGAKVVAYEPLKELVNLVQVGVRVGQRPIDVRHGALVPSWVKRDEVYIDRAEAFYVSKVRVDGSGIAAPAVDINRAIIESACDCLDLDVEGDEFDLLDDIVASGTIDDLHKISIEYHMLNPIMKTQKVERFTRTHKAILDSGFIELMRRVEFEITDYETGEESDRVSLIHVAYTRRGY